MKLDDELRLVILEKVGIYSKRFSIVEPQVFLTNKEVLTAPKEITEGRRTTALQVLWSIVLGTKFNFYQCKKNS